MGIFRNIRRLILVLVSLVLLYAVLGFVVIPWVAESKLPELLSEQLGRTVLVEDIAFNPFTLSLDVQGFEVQESDQSPLFGFQRLFVNFQISSLFRQVYAFETIQLVLPYGLIRVRPDGTLNVSDLGPKTSSDQAMPSQEEEAESPSNGEDGALPAVEIDRLAIEQGMVEFHDDSRQTPFSVDIVPIEISLNHFTTRADSENPYAVTAEFGEGEELQWEGTLVLDPLSSSGKVSLTGLQLQTPWQYLQDQLRFEIHDGVLNISTKYEVTSREDIVKTTLSEGDIHIGKLRMAAKGNTETVLDIPSLDVNEVMVDLTDQRVTIPFVRSKDARLVTWLNDTGQVNYQELFSPIDATERDADSDVTPADSEEPKKKSSGSDRPWVVEVKDFALQNYTVGFEDRTVEPPVKLDLAGLDLQVKRLSTTFDKPFDLALVLTLNETGRIEANGSVDVDPVAVDLMLKLSGLAVAPFYPYFSQHVQFELADGAVDIDGKMQYNSAPEKTPLVHYEGGIALNGLIAKDRELAEEFLTLQSLAVHDLNLDVEPTAVSIGEIELTRPFIKATIGTDGTMNLSRVFSPPGNHESPEASPTDSPEPDESKPASDPLPVKIDRVRLANAEAQFADWSLEPNVLTGIQELAGTISGLSSAQVAKADVDLKGKVGQYAPFEVKGKINPLSQDAYTDLTLNFQRVDLTAVSPYAGKYAGHPITKGKLSLDLKYKIAEHVLEGENKILIDQLTMGGKTGSPDATSLPVPLALALLKDRHGKIDIDLPVRGNLNDPDFSYGRVVLQALVNILTKAATSPFNLIGGLIMGGGGDDLQSVEFALGSDQLEQGEQDKLNSLAQALEERPALRLEVTGTADQTQDRQALIESKFSEQIQALRASAPSSSGAPATSGNEDKARPRDERQLIRLLFVKKFGEAEAKKLEAQPGEAISPGSDRESPDRGAETQSEPVKREPWEEMKRRLLDAIDISERDIRLLAQRRARMIRDHLIQQGKIPEERVFLIEVTLDAEAEQDHVKSHLSLTAG
ncbi:MAG: DUF748 domain-containing protein [Nitrospira sp.]|nr:DUF748 domain-containing protein [Nitrospira sp.]